MSTVGLVLAAGAGRRMGGPKALLRVSGELLVERAVRLLADGGCARVVVVLGAGAEQVQAQVDLPDVVLAADWEQGMGASLRAGLAALPADAPACVVALVDQPLVSPETVRRLLAHASTSPADAVVACYAGAPRNPVLLRRSIWPQVAEAAVGDIGARGWLAAHPDRVARVECGDTGSAADLDTPDDLDRLERDHVRTTA